MHKEVCSESISFDIPRIIEKLAGSQPLPDSHLRMNLDLTLNVPSSGVEMEKSACLSAERGFGSGCAPERE